MPFLVLKAIQNRSFRVTSQLLLRHPLVLVFDSQVLFLDCLLRLQHLLLDHMVSLDFLIVVKLDRFELLCLVNNL